MVYYKKMGIQTQNQKTGRIGEDLACKFLVKHGYRVVQRNYLKVFGEIDIICTKDGILHFVEVKTVLRKTFSSNADEFRAEDNIHSSKLIRIGRTIEVYLNENPQGDEWQFDVITIQLQEDTKVAAVNMLCDLII